MKLYINLSTKLRIDRDGYPATSKVGDERLREARNERETPRSDNVCADPRATELQRTKKEEAVPRNGDAGRMTHIRSRLPHRQRNMNATYSSKKSSGRGEARDEGNGRRKNAARVDTLRTQTAPSIEPRRVQTQSGLQPVMPRDPPREENSHHQREVPRHASPPSLPNSEPTSSPPTYADIVARNEGVSRQDSDTHDSWQQVKRRRCPSPERRPANPRMEGRCYRCLARDHRAQTFREPVRCRLCRQTGHRQYACPLSKREAASLEPTQRTPSGLYACLVGEIIDAEPTLSQIVECIQEISPSSANPKCHRLGSGHILLRDLSKEEWCTMRGWMYHIPGGGCIRWRRPRGTDGAYPAPKETRRLELSGVPFGRRNWKHLDAMLGQMGSLKKIVCDGLQTGNPNCTCVDVEVPVGVAIPSTIRVAAGRDAPMVRVAALPPPPPRGDCLKMKGACDAPTPAKSAVIAPELDVSVEYAAPPGIMAPPEIAPPRGLSSDTVESPSASHEHIELSQQLAADLPVVLPWLASLGEYMEAHTVVHPILPLTTLSPPASATSTQARFSGHVYVSRRRFRSAPAPSRLDAKMELT